MSEQPNIEQFFCKQLKVWPMASANFDALKGVEVKDLVVDGMNIKVQFNPARAISSAAKVDAASLKARPCFLCAQNRPSEQCGIDWAEKYTILVNPFPIFPRHLTIPCKQHVPQAVEGAMADMLRLASMLKDYTVFYNGPRCGASAPDHFHFQAGNSDFLTIADNLEGVELKVVATDNESTLSLVDSLPLKMFVIDAATPQQGEQLFDRLIRAMDVPEGDYEPMMNILAWATPAGVRVAVVPRKRHRPSFYGTEGDGCMLLSPASVDMGGVFITPRVVDYERFDADTVRRVYDELCLSQSEIEQIAEKI